MKCIEKALVILLSAVLGISLLTGVSQPYAVLTALPRFSAAYDAESRLTGVSGGASASFVYDGDGKWVKASFGSSTTVYIGDYYEQTGSTVRKYYYAGGQRACPECNRRVALRQGDVVYYIHSDHPSALLRTGLGSTGLLSDQAGNQVPGSVVRYLPYGGLRLGEASTLPTDYTFTAQRWEPALGLMHYGARFYSPGLRRFISPDTLIANPTNSQNINRYSYTLNSPLCYTDPSGRVCVPCIVVAVVLAMALSPAIVEAPNEAQVASPPSYNSWDDELAFLDSAPGTGDISDVYAIGAGRRLFTGEEQSRLTAAGFAVAPLVAGGMAKGVGRMAEEADLLADIPGVSRLLSNLEHPSWWVRAGAESQAERAAYYAERGLLEGIEVYENIGGKKAYYDLVLKGGVVVETKSWTGWARWGKETRATRLKELYEQLQKYTASGRQVILDWKGEPPPEVYERLKPLIEQGLQINSGL